MLQRQYRDFLPLPLPKPHKPSFMSLIFHTKFITVYEHECIKSFHATKTEAVFPKWNSKTRKSHKQVWCMVSNDFCGHVCTKQMFWSYYQLGCVCMIHTDSRVCCMLQVHVTDSWKKFERKKEIIGYYNQMYSIRDELKGKVAGKYFR